MSLKRYINNRGVTLVELIIVVALIGVIVVPIGTIFITNYRQFYADSAKINASSDMRIAQNQMLNSFRQADQNSISIETEQRVNFDIIQNSNIFNCSIWFDSIEKTLKMQAPGGEITLLKNVSEVTFQYVENGRMSIKLTTVTHLPENSYTYTQTVDYKKRT